VDEGAGPADPRAQQELQPHLQDRLQGCGNDRGRPGAGRAALPPLSAAARRRHQAQPRLREARPGTPSSRTTTRKGSRACRPCPPRPWPSSSRPTSRKRCATPSRSAATPSPRPALPARWPRPSTGASPTRSRRKSSAGWTGSCGRKSWRSPGPQRADRGRGVHLGGAPVATAPGAALRLRYRGTAPIFAP
jgi:hypothetical protein